MRKRVSIAVLATVLAVLPSLASANPTFVNGLVVPGDSLDATLEVGANAGRLGMFSDIYYDPNRDEWYGLSDRGPGGGTLDYTTRVQQFAVTIDPDTGAISDFQIVRTIELTGKGGAPMNGKAPDPTNVLGKAFDPEGFVVSPKNGDFLVSDEYGPSLYEFNRDGRLVQKFKTPDSLIPRDGADFPNFANDTGNVAGKRTNRGFEGLAVSPNGKFLYAMLQSAMLDEGGGDGTVNRIVKFSMKTGAAVAQYAYQMDSAGQGRGISSLVALNDHEFFVLERNNRGVGVGATLASPDKDVYKIDLNGATDVSGIDLDSGAPYTPVTKSALFLDLDVDKIDLDGDGDVEGTNKSPEKWEGLAIGPQLNDGSYLLLAGTDNDYSVTQNGSGTQFDVYFNFNDADPYASSIQCPLDTTSGCFLTSNNSTGATLTANHHLLPGVLHAYKTPAQDLAGYVLPVPPAP